MLVDGFAGRNIHQTSKYYRRVSEDEFWICICEPPQQKSDPRSPIQPIRYQTRHLSNQQCLNLKDPERILHKQATGQELLAGILQEIKQTTIKLENTGISSRPICKRRGNICHTNDLLITIPLGLVPAFFHFRQQSVGPSESEGNPP